MAAHAWTGGAGCAAQSLRQTRAWAWSAVATDIASMALACAFPERSRSWLNTLAHVVNVVTAMDSQNYGAGIIAMNCHAARLALAVQTEVGVPAHNLTAMGIVTVLHATIWASLTVQTSTCGRSDVLVATRLAT